MSLKQIFTALLRDLVWGIPVGMLLLAVFGPGVMIFFVFAAGTVRAITTDMGETEPWPWQRKGVGKRTVSVLLLVSLAAASMPVQAMAADPVPETPEYTLEVWVCADANASQDEPCHQWRLDKAGCALRHLHGGGARMSLAGLYGHQEEGTVARTRRHRRL